VVRVAVGAGQRGVFGVAALFFLVNQFFQYDPDGDAHKVNKKPYTLVWIFCPKFCLYQILGEYFGFCGDTGLAPAHPMVVYYQDFRMW
jgi:hypothetical protein